MQKNIPECPPSAARGRIRSYLPTSCRQALQTLLLVLIACAGISSANAAQVAEVIKTDCVEVTCPTNITLYTCERVAAVRTYPFDVNYTCPNVPPTSLAVKIRRQCRPA